MLKYIQRSDVTRDSSPIFRFLLKYLNLNHIPMTIFLISDQNYNLLVSIRAWFCLSKCLQIISMLYNELKWLRFIFVAKGESSRRTWTFQQNVSVPLSPNNFTLFLCYLMKCRSTYPSWWNRNYVAPCKLLGHLDKGQTQCTEAPTQDGVWGGIIGT